MAPPPAKRRKRNTVLSSDDEEVPTPPRNSKVVAGESTRDRSKLSKSHIGETRGLPTRSRTREKAVLKQQLPTALQQSRTSSSDERPRKTSTNGPANGSLRAFFSKTDQVPDPPKPPKREDKSPAEKEPEEDIIEDDSAEEQLPFQKSAKRAGKPEATRTVLDKRKPLHEQTRDNIITASQEKAINAGPRFLRAGRGVAKDASAQMNAPSVTTDTRPWAEKYAPVDLGELVVHKKKVADVRCWLEGVLQGRYRKRLLVLKGASGVGKTATISTLAKAMDVGITEWKNPVDTEFLSESYLSMSAQFEDFLGRSEKFGSLILSGDETNTDPRPPTQPLSPAKKDAKKLILMEEFPSTFNSTSVALRSFRTAILQHLAPSDLSSRFLETSPTSIHPLIMIITETTTSTSSSDNFTAHRLLGPAILSHPATTVIEFNAVAPTLLVKALEVVLQKDARQSLRRRIPGPSVLKHLAEMGDIRSAIGSLEFLCLRGGDDEDWSGRVASKSKKGSTSAMSKMEQRSLELVSRRESSLGLFHAVGKVVYNKREEPTIANRPSQPPEHLPQHTRLKVSEAHTDTLIDETGTDPRTFIAALHENYVPSCEGPSFTDNLNDCIDALSDADLLTSEHSSRGNQQSKVTEELRQDELAFHIAVRGILFALPYPVKRVAHPVKGGASKAEAFKMRYPMSMRIGRQKEEMEEMVERWMHRAMAGAEDELSVAGRATASSAELLLERLPYVARIGEKKNVFWGGSDLEKITTFRGSKLASAEQSEEDELEADAAKDRAMMPPPKGLPGAGTQVDEGFGKLYLSDDDIEG